MQKKIILFFILFLNIVYASAQQESKASVSYNGLYIGKTGSVPAANLEIFTYLRFYADGTVYLQAVSSNDAAAVSKWFARDKKYSQKGTYIIEGNNITIRLNNDGTADVRLEGKVQTNYKGTITQTNQLCLTRNDEKEENCFAFTKTE